MKERIKSIMDAENMTPARFADSLDIGRAVISHILNGRNNPSLDVITRILTKMPAINSEWLLTGSGSMYRSNDNSSIASLPINDNKENLRSQSSDVTFPDLFSEIPHENSVNTHVETENKEYVKENAVDGVENKSYNVINERIIYKELAAKKIKQIIIYYTDNTFETFKQE